MSDQFDGIYNALDLLTKKVDELERRVEKLEWKPPTERQKELLYKLCQERGIEYPKDVDRKSRKEVWKMINDLLRVGVKK